MPDDALKPGLRAALRYNEIGDASPYQLSFAGKAKSGGSFGFMQGDLAAGQPIVTATFRAAMAAAAMPAAAIDSLVQRLSVHLVASPLSHTERTQVDAALAASAPLVDAMDEAILAGVYTGVDACISHAHATGRTLQPAAQLYCALWINMSGPPSLLLAWLEGKIPHLAQDPPPAPLVIEGADVRAYLVCTDYFTSNPRNLPHLDDSVDHGLAVLDIPASAISPIATSTRRAAPSPIADLPDDCYIYEQATGRMFERMGARNDLLATGYSGSETANYKNNPDAQCVRDLGPICRGEYTIGPPFAGPSPISLRLTPHPATDTCGRDGFLIHGDSIAAPGTASHGCIILNKTARTYIAQNPTGPLLVVAQMTAADPGAAFV